MEFEIISEISSVEIIAIGNSIREIVRLRKDFGRGRWRKMKGIATVRRSDESVRLVELHWYEKNSIGRKEFKVKRNLD